MDPGAHVESECLGGVDDRGRTTDRSSRAVEGREEGVTDRLDLPASEPLELTADGVVVRVQQLPPLAVTDFRCSIGRTHDVSEEQSREHSVGVGHWPYPGQDFLGL